jgi:hypothetical protein
MAYFETKNPNVGKFWSVLQWKMLVYFVAIWYIGYVYGYLVYLFTFWLVVLRKIWQPWYVPRFKG